MSQRPSILNEAAEQEASTLEFLVARGSLISTESRGLAFVDSIKSSFTDFVARLGLFVNGLKVGNFTPRQIKATIMLKAVTARSYQENRNLYVSIQPGFEGKWLPYLKYLANTILPKVETIDATLKVAITKLATIINEPDRLQAQSGIRDLERSLSMVSQDDYQGMQSFFGKGTKAQAPLGSVVDRNADLIDAYTLIDKLNNSLGAIDFTKVQSQLDRLTELTANLKEVLESEENRQLSGTVTAQLSELFYKLGVTLTAGAVLRDAVQQQTEAMSLTADSLAEQIK